MHSLSSRQRTVLRLRFGQGDTVQSREEVGEQLGMSVWAVELIERAALRQLRVDAVTAGIRFGNDWDEV